MSSPVSVVIPTYQGADYIAAALASVFAQTLLPAEVIVVDDGSTDGTPDLVAELARQAPVSVRLVCLGQNSGGPARPMNRGIERAASELVALLDQDDGMAPIKLEAHARVFAAAEGIGLVFGQSRRMNAVGELGPPRDYAYACFTASALTPLPGGGSRLPADEAYRRLLTAGYNYGGAGGTTIAKRAWRALGGFDERLRVAWDYDFALRLTAAGYAVGYTPVVVHHRRWHGANLEAADGGECVRRERLFILRRQAEACRLPADLRSVARAAYRGELLAAAYGYREDGHYGRAFACLATALGRFGPRAAVTVSLLKLGVHFLVRGFWPRAATTADAVPEQNPPAVPEGKPLKTRPRMGMGGRSCAGA
jgi:glycosyltransferase involved in cell wall biosynthesis